MSAAADITGDIAELEQLVRQAADPFAELLIYREIHRLRDKLEGGKTAPPKAKPVAATISVTSTAATIQKIASKSTPAVSQPAKAAPQQTQPPATNTESQPPPPKGPVAGSKADVTDGEWTLLKSYSWLQDDKNVKVYVELADVGSLAAENIKLEVAETSFTLTVTGVNGKNLKLTIPNLCHPVETANSKHITKTDKIIVRLRKREGGVEWSDITDKEENAKRKKDTKIKSNEGKSTEQLLQEMYADGDEETKQSLSKAWHDGRSKREKNAGRSYAPGTFQE